MAEGQSSELSFQSWDAHENNSLGPFRSISAPNSSEWSFAQPETLRSVNSVPSNANFIERDETQPASYQPSTMEGEQVNDASSFFSGPHQGKSTGSSMSEGVSGGFHASDGRQSLISYQRGSQLTFSDRMVPYSGDSIGEKPKSLHGADSIPTSGPPLHHPAPPDQRPNYRVADNRWNRLPHSSDNRIGAVKKDARMHNMPANIPQQIRPEAETAIDNVKKWEKTIPEEDEIEVGNPQESLKPVPAQEEIKHPQTVFNPAVTEEQYYREGNKGISFDNNIANPESSLKLGLQEDAPPATGDSSQAPTAGVITEPDLAEISQNTAQLEITTEAAPQAVVTPVLHASSYIDPTPQLKMASGGNPAVRDARTTLQRSGNSDATSSATQLSNAARGGISAGTSTSSQASPSTRPKETPKVSTRQSRFSTDVERPSPSPRRSESFRTPFQGAFGTGSTSLAFTSYGPGAYRSGHCSIKPQMRPLHKMPPEKTEILLNKQRESAHICAEGDAAEMAITIFEESYQMRAMRNGPIEATPELLDDFIATAKAHLKQNEIDSAAGYCELAEEVSITLSGLKHDEIKVVKEQIQSIQNRESH